MHLAYQPITVHFDTVAWPLSAIVLYDGETGHSWCVHVYKCKYLGALACSVVTMI